MQEVSSMKKFPQVSFCASIILTLLLVLFFLFRNHGSGSVRITDYHTPTETTLAAETICYPIDINTADVEALMTIPGIGNVYAQAIVDYRNEHGSFTDVNDILKVPGVGQKRLEAILGYIIIGGSNEDTGCR
jgi:competence protein ComEA